MKKRDEDRTKRTGEAKLSRAEREETARRKFDNEDERRELVPKLRERARQEYLRKREEDKLKLLEEEIRDEEALFRDEVVTERERRELDRKRELLR